MKPTQQEIIELAREAGIRTYPDWLHGIPVFSLVKLVDLVLERFGAGGGEPFGYFCDWGDHDGIQRIAMYYGEPGSATFDDWNEFPKVHKNLPLYTHPSPTDLRAEYLRGLEDAAKVCDEVSLQANAAWKLAYRPQDQGRETGADECADAIRALKGKQ